MGVLDERTALASDGKSLLLVPVAAVTTEPFAVTLPSAITQLALSPDRKRIAVACDCDVRVLQRR